MMTNLTNSRIFITGGAGFVGSFIVDLLLKENVGEIVIIDNFIRGSRQNIQDGLNSGKVKLIEGDIRDRELLSRSMAGCDFCFHLAALRITQCASEPRHALEVMYDGTFNVLESCVQHKVKKIFLASTASVYGQAEIFPTPETHHPYNNITLYGSAKVANELMCRSFQQMYGLPFVAARYFNIYGPRMDTFGKYTEVFIRWYHLIREGKPPLIFGDGKQTMDFIYIEDVARASVLAMQANVQNEVFNVAGGKETSLEELCLALLDAMGSRIRSEYVPIPDARRKVDVMRRLADVSKARELIGFTPQVALEEGLRRLVHWLNLQEKIVKVS